MRLFLRTSLLQTANRLASRMRTPGEDGAAQLPAQQFSLAPTQHLLTFPVQIRRALARPNVQADQQKQALACTMAFPLLSTKAISLSVYGQFHQSRAEHSTEKCSRRELCEARLCNFRAKIFKAE